VNVTRSPRLSNAADPVCDTRSRTAPEEETYAGLVVDHVVERSCEDPAADATCIHDDVEKL